MIASFCCPYFYAGACCFCVGAFRTVDGGGVGGVEHFANRRRRRRRRRRRGQASTGPGPLANQPSCLNLLRKVEAASTIHSLLHLRLPHTGCRTLAVAQHDWQSHCSPDPQSLQLEIASAAEQCTIL